MSVYLGRFQAGEAVPIAASIVDGDGLPAAPDAAPLVTITGPDAAVIATIKMAMSGDARHFSAPYLLGVGPLLGTYTVACSYSVAGSQYHAIGSFDVIAGGDAGGTVVSLYAYARPEAQYVVAQLSSGMLVYGRNPKL